MTTNELVELICRKVPATMLKLPGAVLFSGISTLKPSKAYVMGLNPGGDPKQPFMSTPIIEAIAPRDGTSCYTHECWQPNCAGPEGRCEHIGPDGATLERALVKHQHNVCELARTLGATPANLFSANAIFGRSTSRTKLKEQTGYDLKQWWEACWPVHREFLSIVRPKTLITLGYGDRSSAFGLLRAKAGGPQFERLGDEGRRGGWTFNATFLLDENAELKTKVIGVPHPSYFAPGPLLSKKLRVFLDG